MGFKPRWADSTAVALEGVGKGEVVGGAHSGAGEENFKIIIKPTRISIPHISNFQ